MVAKISIIVPVYNAEKYLYRCIESILNQSYTNFELILVNDGSTDNSEKIIQDFAAKDKRIVGITQLNSGPSEARNKGILNSTGEYLVFIDSDDKVDKNYLNVLLENIVSYGSDIVCCGYRDLSKYGIINCMDFEIGENLSKHSFMEMVCKGTGGVLWGKIFKKDIIDKHNLKLNKKIFMCEDLVFVLQYAAHCKKFSSINEFLYEYNRLNFNSISHQFSLKYVENYINVFESIETVLNSVNLNRKEIDDILTMRIQNFFIGLIEQQIGCLKETGIRKAFENVKYLLSVQYVDKYKMAFNTRNLIYKPLLFFVKGNHILPAIFYSLYMFFLRKSKRKFAELIR